MKFWTPWARSSLRTPREWGFSRWPAHLFNRRLKVSSNRRMFQFVLILDRDMANPLALSNQEPIRVGKESATVEPQVYVSAVGHDVTKPILNRFAGERESNRQGVSPGDGFD